MNDNCPRHGNLDLAMLTPAVIVNTFIRGRTVKGDISNTDFRDARPKKSGIFRKKMYKRGLVVWIDFFFNSCFNFLN